MALGAMANDPSLNVQIIPVGLSYFHRDRFRSRAVIEFGAAVGIPPELVKMFKEGGSQKKAAGSQLLDLIYEALKTVTLRAPDPETLMVNLTILSIMPCFNFSAYFSGYPSSQATIRNSWATSHS